MSQEQTRMDGIEPMGRVMDGIMAAMEERKRLREAKAKDAIMVAGSLASALSATFPLLMKGMADTITAEVASEQWDEYERAEQQLGGKCRGCHGVGFYEIGSSLPDLDACKRPVLDEGKVKYQRCPVQEEYRRRVMAKRLLGESNLPRRFQRRTLENFIPRSPNSREAKMAAQQFIGNFGCDDQQGLLIMGPNGTGKTHLAAGIMMALIQNGILCRFYTAPDLIAALRGAIADNKVQDTLMALAELPCLVVDDLGKERLRRVDGEDIGWADELWFTLINRRYEEDRPTVFTTNLNDHEIIERYGTAIYSRFVEMCRPILLDEEDYRIYGPGGGRNA